MAGDSDIREATVAPIGSQPIREATSNSGGGGSLDGLASMAGLDPTGGALGISGGGGGLDSKNEATSGITDESRTEISTGDFNPTVGGSGRTTGSQGILLPIVIGVVGLAAVFVLGRR